jgi:hypothetical protein
VFHKWKFLTKRAASNKSRSVLGACLTHILHDGYTDQLCALLPVRALYYGTMGGLQVPADRWTSRLKPTTSRQSPTGQSPTIPAS